MLKSFLNLSMLNTFEERYAYLRHNTNVGQDTFGFERYLNQTLYRSAEWKRIREQVIIRDEGCDLGILERPISRRIIIHHINPITVEDIENRHPLIFDLDNLITTSHNTHNAIHYSDASLLTQLPKERQRGDTCPWKVY